MTISYRTPRSRIEGLGSAKTGTGDFWRQRLTAVALIPLVLWFVWSALHLVGADYAAAAAFFESPVHAIVMLLLLIAALIHMSIGMQVVIEDYLHGGTKIACVMLNRFFVLAVGATIAFSLLKLAFAGTAP